MKRILLVTHHFPPDTAVGGVRAAKFAKYLPQFGWEPVVLTVKESYYDVIDCSLSGNRRLSCPVIRCNFVRNPSHHYRKLKRLFFGKSSIENVGSPANHDTSNKATLRDWLNALLAFPDEDTGWIPFAMLKGGKTIRRFGINSILSSGPPHSTHLLGAWLSKRARLPWIADFRDPLFLPDKSNHVSLKLDYKLEAFVMAHASLVLTTTERLKNELARRHPAYGHKVYALPNGYDPDDFASVPRQKAKRFTISYLGTLYRNRDPEPVLCAVSRLIEKGLIARNRLMLRFVGDCENAAGKPMRALIDKYSLDGNVELSPWLPRESAFEVMMQSHVLLLLAENQALMVPAKVYDYLATGADILALTEDGATADLLRSTGKGAVLLPDDHRDIERSIENSYRKFLNNKTGSDNRESDSLLKVYTRQHLTRVLVGVLEKVVA